MVDPATAAQRWVQGMQNASAKVTAGVQAVTVAPQQKAVAQANFWQSQVSSPTALAKFKANLSASTLQDWQNGMTQKGIPAMATGARAAQGKFQAFMSALLPYEANLQSQIQAMPKGGLENGIARSSAWQRGMAQFKY